MVSEQIMNEIMNGQGQPLARLARIIPPYRQGKSTTLSCLLRWTLHGVLSPDGSRVRLEAVRMAGRWISTPSAIGRFIQAQTPPTDPAPQPVPRSPAKRLRASERAAIELEKLGV